MYIYIYTYIYAYIYCITADVFKERDMHTQSSLTRLRCVVIAFNTPYSVVIVFDTPSVYWKIC